VTSLVHSVNFVENLIQLLAVVLRSKHASFDLSIAFVLHRKSTCMPVFLQDLMQFSLEKQDRRAQAYCMLCFADIHRVRKDPEKALPRYDSALGLMLEIGDRYGQTLIAVGKAKAYIGSRNFEEVVGLIVPP